MPHTASGHTFRIQLGSQATSVFQSKYSTRRPTRRLSDNTHMPDVIVRDPDTMHGVPVFRGTRVPVQTLFDYLEGGETLDEFLEGFPTVSRAMALDGLDEARTLLLTSPISRTCQRE